MFLIDIKIDVQVQKKKKRKTKILTENIFTFFKKNIQPLYVF